MKNLRLIIKKKGDEMMNIHHASLIINFHSGALKTLSSEWNPATPPLTANFMAWAALTFSKIVMLVAKTNTTQPETA